MQFWKNILKNGTTTIERIRSTFTYAILGISVCVIWRNMHLITAWDISVLCMRCLGVRGAHRKHVLRMASKLTIVHSSFPPEKTRAHLNGGLLLNSATFRSKRVLRILIYDKNRVWETDEKLQSNNCLDIIPLSNVYNAKSTILYLYVSDPHSLCCCCSCAKNIYA